MKYFPREALSTMIMYKNLQNSAFRKCWWEKTAYVNEAWMLQFLGSLWVTRCLTPSDFHCALCVVQRKGLGPDPSLLESTAVFPGTAPAVKSKPRSFAISFQRMKKGTECKASWAHQGCGYTFQHPTWTERSKANPSLPTRWATMGTHGTDAASITSICLGLTGLNDLVPFYIWVHSAQSSV